MREGQEGSSSIFKGKWGEGVALRYLQKKGCRVLEKNWRSRWGEIDLIVERGKILIFVEVKFRHSRTYGRGAESIHPLKQQRLVRTALHYLQQHRKKDCEILLAALIIEGTPPNSTIEYFEFPLDLPARYY